VKEASVRAEATKARYAIRRACARNPQNNLPHKLRRGAEPLYTEDHQNQKKAFRRTRRRLSSKTAKGSDTGRKPLT
jgi:hypothetical protein